MAATPTGAATPSPVAITPTVAPVPTSVAVAPCDLVTQEEAEAAAGTDLQPAHANGSQCLFGQLAEGPIGQVEVYVDPALPAAYPPQTGVPVPGIADQAYYVADENTLVLRQGETWVALRLVTLNALGVDLPALETLARIVVSRLPAP